MAEQTYSLVAVPAGAVFEAAQKSLRSLNFKIRLESAEGLHLEAKKPGTFTSSAIDIQIDIGEVGHASELRISAKSAALLDLKGPHLALESLKRAIDQHIDEIRDEGRISDPVAPQYSMGSSKRPIMGARAASPRSPAFSADIEPVKRKKEKEKQSGGGIGGFLILLALVHFTIGWEWVGNLTSGKTTEERRTELVATLRGLPSASAEEFDAVRIARALPQMTEVQLEALENSLRGRIIRITGPVYDVEEASRTLGLRSLNITLFDLNLSRPRVLVEGRCIAQTDHDWNELKNLRVGRQVTMIGEFRSMGRYMGVRVQNCVIIDN